jgi:uncharacterized protein with GYD domain
MRKVCGVDVAIRREVLRWTSPLALGDDDDRPIDERRGPMPRYLSLINWTEQGVANFKDTVDRYDAAQQQFEQLGVRFEDVYWTLGEYDIVTVLEAPDDETAAAALLAVGSQGNIRTTTMRAFSRDEMRTVIEKAP